MKQLVCIFIYIQNIHVYVCDANPPRCRLAQGRPYAYMYTHYVYICIYIHAYGMVERFPVVCVLIQYIYIYPFRSFIFMDCFSVLDHRFMSGSKNQTPSSCASINEEAGNSNLHSEAA